MIVPITPKIPERIIGKPKRYLENTGLMLTTIANAAKVKRKRISLLNLYDLSVYELLASIISGVSLKYN
jgi:hypothetical protein